MAPSMKQTVDKSWVSKKDKEKGQRVQKVSRAENCYMPNPMKCGVKATRRQKKTGSGGQSEVAEEHVYESTIKPGHVQQLMEEKGKAKGCSSGHLQ